MFSRNVDSHNVRILRGPLMRLLAVAALLVLALGWGLRPAPVLAQDQSLIWDRFDVDIAVKLNGTFDVVESQTIRFTSGTFGFGYRSIPVANFSYIDNWAVTDDAGNSYQPAASGGEPYTFTVDQGGGTYEVRWYFPRTANSTATYRLSYTVHGGLRYYQGGDQLWWKAIYGDRAYPVVDGRVRVVVPEPATVQEWAAYINGDDARGRATAEVVTGEQAVVFELGRRLESGEEFEVRVQFTPGVVDGSAQPWQAAADEAAAQREAEIAYQEKWGPLAAVIFGGLGVLLMLGGPAALYALWYRSGRDRAVPMVAEYLPEPPDELAPGLAGALLDETVDMRDIISTLIDLARRKAISITEVKEEGLFRMGTDYIYRRERSDVALLPYEKQLLNAVFGKRDERKLSDLRNKFYEKLPGLSESMYKALVDEGLFPRNPNTVRTIYYVLGFLGLAAAVGVTVVLLATFGGLTSAAALPGIGLGITALGLVILARYMPRKTDKGAETGARWQAFKVYLKNIEKYSDIEAQKEIWDQWLPYAVAFGIDNEYIRKFARVDAPAPGWWIPSPEMYGPYRGWYYGTPWVGPVRGGGTNGGERGGSFGGGLGDASKGMGTSLAGMSAGLGGMLNSAGSIFVSRPASSSGGGGGWSGGGGGWSGGGGFGGGGGGGGGGGFG